MSMTAQAPSFLDETIQNFCATLTLNRPPANSLNLALLKEIRQKLTSFEKNPDVRAVVILSAIPKYFSSGLDLQELTALKKEDKPKLFLELIELHRQLCLYPKPTIAAIEGSALLGGWIIAMGCDFRLMSPETGKIALSEVRLGLTPTSILVNTLSRMGAKQSLVKEIILAGRTVKAQEAFDGGLIDRLVPSADLKQEALDLGLDLAQLPQNAYAVTKRCYRESLCGGDFEKIFDKGVKEFLSTLNHWEAQEGLEAAWQKRRPKYIREQGETK